MRVCKKFKFDAAHYLPGYDGVCRRLHGHTWFLEVEIEGPVVEVSGFVVDFVVLKQLVQSKVLDVLDHQCLNDVLKRELRDDYGVTNPTCENLLVWIWGQLNKSLQFEVFPESSVLTRLRLYESPDSYAEIP